MRLLHTSDWHLGKKLDRFDRLDEQKQVMEEICAIADREKVDAVLVAGDLFDVVNPPAEAVDLLYKTLKQLAAEGTRPVIAIAGNHDIPERIEAPDPLARECGIIFSGFPHSIITPFSLKTGLQVARSDTGFVELVCPNWKTPLRIVCAPYANEYRMRRCLGFDNQENELRDLLAAHWNRLADTYCDKSGVNVMIGHLMFAENGGPVVQEPDDEHPILYIGGAQTIYADSIPLQIQYVAAGHLHRYQSIGSDRVTYSGSPLEYSFAETDQNKFVAIVDCEAGSDAIVKPEIIQSGRKLLRKRCTGTEEALLWLKENPGPFVELTMATDTYLSAEEQKALNQAHDRITALIPEVASNSGIDTGRESIDLSQSIQVHFNDYFRQVYNGQSPPAEIIDLFNEVIAHENAPDNAGGVS